MKKIKLSDGREISYEFFERIQPYYMGAEREGVRCRCNADAVSVAELNGILDNEKLLAEFSVEGEDGSVEIKTGYVIKKELCLRNEVVQPETPDSPAVYANVLYFELCQRTYIEQKLHDLGVL